MNKTWVNTGKEEDRIIGFGNDMIYKANPIEELITDYADKIEENELTDDVLRVPFSYIKSIQYQEGKNYIQIFFGQDSEEHLRITDNTKRLEILAHFKQNIPNVDCNFEKYSALKSGKKPLIVVSLLFAWTLYLAIQIELGYDYELIGHGNSITGVVLGLAYLGVFKVILLFGSFITIAIWSMIKKMRNRPEVHELVIVR